MERSLHRVSLGGRRAHPTLSFYLTTFGKCFWARQRKDCFLGNPSQKGKPLRWQRGCKQVLFLFRSPSLTPSSRLSKSTDTTCCPLQLVLPHLAAIITSQFIFQRSALYPH